MAKLTEEQAFTAQRQAEIRTELDRILASKRFINASRMHGMLRYVVEETLAGRRDRIKAFSIAQDVFGRDASFDQQRDPIVRVEASRLRKCLSEYYDEAEVQSGIRIDIPKGGYGPVFTDVKAPAQGAIRWGGLLSVLLILGVLGFSWISWFGNRETAPIHTPLPQSNQVLLAVLPLTHNSADTQATLLANSFVESTITLLARQPGLSVIAHSSMLEFENEKVNIAALQRDYGVTHVLRGSLERRGEDLRIGVQLVSVANSQTAWSQQLEGNVSQLWELEDSLALKVLQALPGEDGNSAPSTIPGRYTNSVEALTLYHQGLFMIIPPNEVERVKATRQLFARVRELDPEFAGGYAGASWSYTLPVLFQTTPDREAYLKQASSLAGEAIKVDPDFGAGYVVQGLAQVLAGDSLAAMENARMGVAVQPGDAFVQFLGGVVFVLSGHPEEAYQFLVEALRLNPIEKRSPYLNVYGIAHVVGGEYQQALHIFARNDARGGPQGPHMAVFRAAAYAQLGDQKNAREIVRDLNVSAPDYPYAGWLRDWMGDRENLESTLRLLSELGLSLP